MNNLKKCKTCGENVAKSAKTCPHCGAKLKMGRPILTAIVVFFVIIAIFGSTDSGKDNKPKKANVPVQATETNTNTNNGNQNVQPPVEEEKTEFYKGETAELNDVYVTLTGLYRSNGSTFNTPAEGNTYVLCEFDITNNSKKDINISSLLSFEAYCDDYACTYNIGAMLEKGNKNQLDGMVASGKKMTGVVGYEVPKSWNELEIRFTPDFWTGHDIVFIVNNE